MGESDGCKRCIDDEKWEIREAQLCRDRFIFLIELAQHGVSSSSPSPYYLEIRVVRRRA